MDLQLDIHARDNDQGNRKEDMEERVQNNSPKKEYDKDRDSDNNSNQGS